MNFYKSGFTCFNLRQKDNSSSDFHFTSFGSILSSVIFFDESQGINVRRLLFKWVKRVRMICLAFIFPLISIANTQEDSLSQPIEPAFISILTCGPGPDIYEAFGHTAIRVNIPAQGIDLVFNYGIFDFNQANFYQNFIKGSMRYMLGVGPTDEFLYQYRYYKRSVREQVLNLDSTHIKAIIQYLNINMQPENREYYYDYFDNNCSTKIIELLDSALNHKVRWKFIKPDGKVTFRSMIHKATVFQPWGRLGIDLGLGALIDKPITGAQLDFLPDYVESDLNRAEILKDQDQLPVPLVRKSSVLYESDGFFGLGFFWMHPAFIFNVVLLFSILMYWKSDKWAKGQRIWTSLLMLVAGLVGLLDFGIWFFTNHKTAAWNYNLIWANPLFLFLAFYWMINRNTVTGLKSGLFWYLAAGLAFWFVVPQELNVNLLPFVLAMLICFIAPNRWKTKSVE